MDKETFQKKTMELGIRIIKMVGTMPQSNASRVIGGQLLRSSTSVGANYRAACRAKSKKDFINKLKIVEEEADETLFWLELIEKSGFFSRVMLDSLKLETDELISMIVSSLKTLKSQNIKS
jgi:four helix bundle protein